MLSIVIPIVIIHPVIEKMTVECIDSIYKNTLGDWELILVIHGGPNFGFVLDHPRIKILYREEQLSISRAYNLGFGEATGDVLCCMHNDVVVPFGWNYLLDRVAKRGDIAFPMVNEDKGFCELRGIPKTEPWQPPSACFALSRRSWEELGGYDEQFVEMHGEDIDLFKRAKQAGKNLVRCDVTIIHYRGATRSLTKDLGAKAFMENWNKYYFKHAQKPGEEISLPRISETPEEVLRNDHDLQKDDFRRSGSEGRNGLLSTP